MIKTFQINIVLSKLLFIFPEFEHKLNFHFRFNDWFLLSIDPMDFKHAAYKNNK